MVISITSAEYIQDYQIKFSFSDGMERMIDFIRNLPANQLEKIKSDLENTVAKNENEKTDFQKFILKGPVMTDEQYSAFKDNRKAFNQWRSK